MKNIYTELSDNQNETDRLFIKLKDRAKKQFYLGILLGLQDGERRLRNIANCVPGKSTKNEIIQWAKNEADDILKNIDKLVGSNLTTP